MSFVKSTSSSAGTTAVKLSAVIRVRIDGSGSTYNITVDLADGSSTVMSDYSSISDAQTAFANWLTVHGHMEV